MSAAPEPLLEAVALRKHFRLRGAGRGSEVQAVSGVSFRVRRGTTLGVVGESGCGKSTVARLLVGLEARDDGALLLDGQEIGHDAAALRRLRRRVQMVFQDSYASLNPRMSVEASVAFGPRVHGLGREAARRRAHELLGQVGLDPDGFAGRYPHELSGGQRQRVNIARALAMRPELVILDEAVSALDKSVEAQVINLLVDLKSELGLTYVFISHDLNVVRFVSDDVLVMYLGQVVEVGPAAEVLERPRHPYTRALQASMPSMDPAHRTLEAPIAGDPPSPIDPPSGCRFHPRCPFSERVCAEVPPPLHGTEHRAACHMAAPDSGHSRAGGAPP